MVYRLWGSIQVGEADDCWEWAKGRHDNGYGRIVNDDGVLVRAHRAAYEDYFGCEIPIGMVVMHACDNRACCNPFHLSLGTQADNLRDMRRKGRQARGERHGHAKFSDAQIAEMRSRAGAGESLGSIAQAFDTYYKFVWEIVAGGKRGQQA